MTTKTKKQQSNSQTSTVVLNRRIHADAYLPTGLLVEDKGEPPMMMRAKDIWVDFMKKVPKGQSFAVPVKRQHVISSPKQVLRKEGIEFVARTLHEDGKDVCRYYRIK